MPLLRPKAHLRFKQYQLLHNRSHNQLLTSMTLFTSSTSRLRWNVTRNRESFKDFVTPRESRKTLSTLLDLKQLVQQRSKSKLRPDSKGINSFSLQSCSYLLEPSLGNIRDNFLGLSIIINMPGKCTDIVTS